MKRTLSLQKSLIVELEKFEKTCKKQRIGLDKTEKTCYNTDMRNNNESNEMKTTSTTITYREWLIARNEYMTQGDKEEATRAYMVKERAALTARKDAKNFTKQPYCY